MLKNLTAVCVLAVYSATLFSAIAWAQETPGETKKLKIISSLPLTGSANAQTTSVINGIRMAIDEEHLQSACDPQQMLFELHGLILALHHDARFLRHPDAVERAQRAFSRILAEFATPQGLASIQSDSGESKPGCKR